MTESVDAKRNVALEAHMVRVHYSSYDVKELIVSLLI